MTYEFYRIEFKFNKNGNFFVMYDGKLLRREQLIVACEDALFSLDCRIVYSNSDYGTNLSMSHFVPRGFTYRELKALLLVTIHNWFCILPVDDNKLKSLSAILSRLESDRSRYMGHIPSAIIRSDVKEDKVISAYRVKDSVSDCESLVCLINGDVVQRNSWSGLLCAVKYIYRDLSEKYNLKIKVCN